jgi:flagella basal body P-ring formation protein FlgA
VHTQPHRATETGEKVDLAVKQLSIRFLTLLVALLATPAGAGLESSHQDLGEIRDAVARFVERHHDAEGLRVSPGDLDPRLRLARCASALQTEWANGSARVGQVTVEVRCTDERPWRLYVPTRVSLMRQVVVASRPLARGQRLSGADLALGTRDLGRLGGDPVRDPTRVTGYVLTRPLPSGAVLEARLLEAPRLVERGQRVRLVVEAAGIHISMTGQAVEAGALGETIRVRNPASRRVVDAVVTGPGQAALTVALPTASYTETQ